MNHYFKEDIVAILYLLELNSFAWFLCFLGGATIAAICEYDALPGIGHACGHNLIAEIGLGVGICVKEGMEKDPAIRGKVMSLLGLSFDQSRAHLCYLLLICLIFEMSFSLLLLFTVNTSIAAATAFAPGTSFPAILFLNHEGRFLWMANLHFAPITRILLAN